MVPIVGQRLSGRKELLYNGAKLPKHPVASLRARNETSLTLERGPVTVIEDSDYAGEAVLPFTRPGGELIVPYAVELGVSVVERPDSARQIASIAIHNELLVFQEWQVQSVAYLIQSSLAAPVDVIVERAIPSGYELFETPAPVEQSQGAGRWVVACQPGAETRFVLQFRRMQTRHEQVRGANGNQLREYLRRRFLDDTTVRELEGVLALYQQINANQQRIQQIDRERQKLYERQQQTQGSLGPLGRDGEEGRLRSRYVALLGDLENQLGKLADEEQRLNAEIAQLEQQASDRLAALTRKTGG
jgi:cell division protein FtsB